MFDWARGSLLKRMIERGLPKAEWDASDTHWLKNWNNPWLAGLLRLGPEHRILDVGSSTPLLAALLHRRTGCEAHVLDVPAEAAGNPVFGFTRERLDAFPEVQFHLGLAGADVLPAESFDFVSCISVMEHTYDHVSPLDPARPLAHVNVLRDLVRMLKPGGVLLMNWDTYLEGVHHHVGWDFEVDYRLLRHCGLTLLDPRRRVRGEQYIHDHPETLFFAPEVIAGMGIPRALRATAINMLWRKPGPRTRVELAPDPALEPFYFPDGEVTDARPPAPDDTLTTAAIEGRFRAYLAQADRVLRAPRAA